MSQPHTTRPHHLTRLAWIGALVLVLRFAGAELHHVLDVHAPGESCEACLVLERGGNALPPPGLAAPAPPRVSAGDSFAPVRLAATLLLAPLPRGPPLSSA
jgi:hypothetical protein